MKDVISSVAEKAAAEQFEERYARVFRAMSLEQAKQTLGFGRYDKPTSDEVLKAYRSLAIANHPDRGGDTEKMVQLNVAKDILDGKARPSSGTGGGAGRPPPGGWRPEDEVKKPEPPKVVDVIGGEAFSIPGLLLGATEIKFISKTAYGQVSAPTEVRSIQYSYDMWAIYGWNESNKTHVFVGLRKRVPIKYHDSAKGGTVEVEESWEFNQEKYPGSKDITKIATIAIKKVMTDWKDGLKPSRQLKYIAWPGGKLTEATLAKVKSSGYSGGAALKDILVGQGLIGGDAAKGHKSNVEMYYKTNKEKRVKINERIKGGERLDMWLGYDWFVRVNGTEYLLSDKSVEQLIRKHFISLVLKASDMGEGVPKNLTKMKGSPWRHSFALKAHEALNMLVDNLVGEPSGLVLGLMKALEDWEEHFDGKSKKAGYRQLVASMGLHDAAHMCGVEPHEILRAWE
jgi:hypothetical protein